MSKRVVILNGILGVESNQDTWAWGVSPRVIYCSHCFSTTYLKISMRNKQTYNSTANNPMVQTWKRAEALNQSVSKADGRQAAQEKKLEAAGNQGTAGQNPDCAAPLPPPPGCTAP